MVTDASRRTRLARVHRALGDAGRLAIVEHLWLSDLTPSQLRSVTGFDWNLLAFHLNVLEEAGVVRRRRSDGDGRRRYVALRAGELPTLAPPPRPAPERPRALFVCTSNAARSQFAVALWRQATGLPASSAGADPAPAVHPLAVKVAKSHGLDLSGARPRGLGTIGAFDLVVSVCDRAREGGLPAAPATLHWSVPDPIRGTRNDFEAAFAEITGRVTRLAAVAA